MRGVSHIPYIYTHEEFELKDSHILLKSFSLVIKTNTFIVIYLKQSYLQLTFSNFLKNIIKLKISTYKELYFMTIGILEITYYMKVQIQPLFKKKKKILGLRSPNP